MSAEPFRFLHSGDFRLHLPVAGLAEVPEHLRNTLIDAPYRAAERVFDAALSSNVDFVLLTGDLVDVRYSGPRGLVFLQDQFERLAKQNIQVYWIGGDNDAPDIFPTAARWPHNVHWFTSNAVEDITHLRNERPIATILGASQSAQTKIRAKDYSPDPAGHFTIAMAYGISDGATLERRQIPYWALGGKLQKHALYTERQFAQWAGSPQGRQPEHVNAHGCVLVSVEDSGEIATRWITTDAVRWQTERIDLPAGSSHAEIQNRLEERAAALSAGVPERTLLVRWRLAGDAELTAELRQGDLAEELAKHLRARCGHGTTPLWTATVESVVPQTLTESWYEEETILGDFLRTVRDYQHDASLPLDLSKLVPAHQVAEGLAGEVALDTQDERAEVLRQAALIGASLLRGEGA